MFDGNPTTQGSGPPPCTASPHARSQGLDCRTGRGHTLLVRALRASRGVDTGPSRSPSRDVSSIALSPEFLLLL